MPALLCLLLVAAPPDGLAPLWPGHAAPGAKADVVLRPEGPLVPGALGDVRLLVSDAVTDAPVEGADVSFRFFGPKGSPEVDVPARAGALPGHYLARFTPSAPGTGAFVASVDGDLAAGDGVPVVPSTPAPRRLPWPLGLVLVGAGVALARPRREAAALLALGLLCLASGDARAHGTYVPPPAAVAGADEYVAQEIQFALGIRTATGRIEAFEPPGGGAPRQFLAVPESAVVERDGKKLLFVRLAPERFVAREPKLGGTGITDGVESVAVLSGLELDEKVVVAGAAYLRNGGAAKP